MIKPQHDLLNYHTLPVQAPGRSSNHRCLRMGGVAVVRSLDSLRALKRATALSTLIRQHSINRRRTAGIYKPNDLGASAALLCIISVGEPKHDY